MIKAILSTHGLEASALGRCWPCGCGTNCDGHTTSFAQGYFQGLGEQWDASAQD